GFEGFALMPGAFKYNPAGTPWSYSGTAGVASDYSPFTAGNPTAPQGSQVAFLQGTGGMSQSVTFAAGTYAIGFAAAQRGNAPALQTFQVLVDGKVVGTFNNFGGANYGVLATSTFTVTAGAHTVAFRGTNLLGGDNTIFIDQVTVAQQATSLNDSGFEGLPATATGIQYAPSGSAWTFGGSAGVTWAGTAFTSGNPPPAQGSQAAFLQGLGSVSQSATF